MRLEGMALEAPLSSVRLPVDQLTPYYRNPRRGDLEAIARSLTLLGQYRPIVVNQGSLTGRRLEVLAGSHTLLAARQLGWDAIDAVLLDVDEETAKKIVLADNRLPELGTYDDDVLTQLLKELPELDATGYETYDIDALLADIGPAPLAPARPSTSHSPQATLHFRPESDISRLDHLRPQPCPQCGYDVANDPDQLRKAR